MRGCGAGDRLTVTANDVEPLKVDDVERTMVSRLPPCTRSWYVANRRAVFGIT